MEPGFFLFLRALSWESDLWVMPYDLPVKNVKLRKKSLHLTENQLSRNEMWYRADTNNYICHICAKVILDLNFYEAVIHKRSNLHEIAPNCI